MENLTVKSRNINDGLVELEFEELFGIFKLVGKWQGNYEFLRKEEKIDISNDNRFKIKYENLK